MANIISIMLRAVTLVFLSSLSNSRPFSPRTWQYSHSTPSEAVMNCMEGRTRSAGTPFSTLMFLNSSSASLGAAVVCGVLDWAFAPATARPMLSVHPHKTNPVLRRFEFIRAPSAMIFCEEKCIRKRAAAARGWERQSSRRLGGEVAAFGESADAIAGPESERFDSHGGLATAGGNETAAITEEKVFYVVR